MEYHTYVARNVQVLMSYKGKIGTISHCVPFQNSPGVTRARGFYFDTVTLGFFVQETFGTITGITGDVSGKAEYFGVEGVLVNQRGTLSRGLFSPLRDHGSWIVFMV